MNGVRRSDVGPARPGVRRRPSSFKSLIGAGAECGTPQEQRRAEREFPGRVAASHLHFLDTTPAPPAPSAPSARGDVLRLCVGLYVRDELCLLDHLDRLVASSPATGLKVEVIDTSRVGSLEAAQRIVPVAATGLTTPLAAFWREGLLQWAVQGYDARLAIAKILGRPLEDLLPRPNPGPWW